MLSEGHTYVVYVYIYLYTYILNKYILAHLYSDLVLQSLIIYCNIYPMGYNFCLIMMKFSSNEYIVEHAFLFTYYVIFIRKFI